MRRRPPTSRLGFPAGAATMVAIAALDIAYGPRYILIGSIVVGPILAVLSASPRQVTALSAAAVLLALISPIWNENLDQVDFPIRTAAIVLACAAAVLAARSRDREQASLRRMGVLAELSTIADDAPAVEPLAERIADILSRTVADVAIVDGVTVDGPVRLAVRGDDALAAALAAMPAADAPAAPACLVAPDDDLSATVSADPERAAEVRDRFGSAIVVPLAARGRPVGTLTLVTLRGHPNFDDADLEFTRIAAGRAALALDNAGLSSELTIVERQLAAALSSLAEAVTVQDLRGRVVFANQDEVLLFVIGFG